MSAPLPNALRARFQQYIEDVLSGRAAALRLRLSPATARDGRGLSERGVMLIPPLRAALAGEANGHRIRPFSKSWWLRVALLHKSADGRAPLFSGHPYPTGSVTGMPSAVKPFITATRI
jgi:hypothetical protein